MISISRGFSPLFRGLDQGKKEEYKNKVVELGLSPAKKTQIDNNLIIKTQALNLLKDDATELRKSMARKLANARYPYGLEKKVYLTQKDAEKEAQEVAGDKDKYKERYLNNPFKVTIDMGSGPREQEVYGIPFWESGKKNAFIVYTNMKVKARKLISDALGQPEESENEPFAKFTQEEEKSDKKDN